jgi:hypothetical protein
MDYFRKNRWVLWLLISLILMNIFSLATIWWLLMPRRFGPACLPDRASGPAALPRFFQKELGLNAAQGQVFESALQEHFQKIHLIFQAMHERRKQIFESTFHDPYDPSKVERLSREIGALQTELETKMAEHFRQLRRLCQPEQQAKFKKIFEQFLDQIDPSKMPGIPEPERRAAGPSSSPGRP